MCEAMLFYGEVVVVTDRPTIKSLIDAIGIETLFSLVENGYLKLHHLEEHLVIRSENVGGDVRNIPARISRIDLPLEDEIEEHILKQTEKRGKSRRQANRLLRSLEPIAYSDFIEQSFMDNIRRTDYIKRAVSHLLNIMLKKDVPISDFQFEAESKWGGFVIHTDLDFTALNATYHKHVPASHSTLSSTYLLSHILSLQAELYFMSVYKSDIATDPRYTAFHSLELGRTLSSDNKCLSEMQMFSEFLFEGGKSISEAINSGKRSVSDFLPLLEKSHKFKSWLKNAPDDHSVIKEYFNECTKQTWIDKLPAKSMRWLIFTAAGLAVDAAGGMGLGTAGSVALSALDQFYIDRLLKGWKPNMFIDEDCMEFLSES